MQHIGIFFYFSPMEFKIDKKEKYTAIQVLVDKLDVHIAPSLKSELVLVSGSGENNILLDLSRCTYCDSSGLSAVLVANRLCKNAEGTFVVGGITPNVERLISISQLDKVLNIAYNIERADEMMKGMIK